MRMLTLHHAICAAAGLLVSGSALAEKTEVKVLRGAVKAEAPAGTVTIESGRKAVLTTQASPMVAVDDPLVQDLLAMYPWVEAERKAARMRILSATIQVYRLEDGTCQSAVLGEMPNLKSLPSDACRIGETSLLGNARFYDLSGRLLKYDLTPTAKDKGFYTIHFPQPIAPKETFRMVMAGDYGPGDAKTLKEGSLRYYTASNGSPNSLNYYQVILPKGAIYVDANLPTVCIKQLDGRTAVTIRSYSGKQGDSRFIIAFLWPEKDGTTLADLPPHYRGLREARDEMLAAEYSNGMKTIRGGGAYNDLSDPVRALLTWNSAVAKQDKTLLRKASHAPQIDDKMWDQYVTKDMLTALSSDMDTMDFLGTPAWPETLEEGYVHPVYMSWPGSRMRQDTLAVTYSGGQWRRCGNMGNPWNTDVSVFKAGSHKPRWRLDLSPRGLEEIPWNSIGPDILTAFRSLLANDEQDTGKCSQVGLKLAGAGQYEYALMAFAHCEGLHSNDDNMFLAATWQGHMYDALGKRSEAIEKYKTALTMAGARQIAHKQWGIVIDARWVQARLAEPFRREIILAPADPTPLHDAYLSLRSQETDELLKTYDTFGKQDVRDPIAWCYLAVELVDKQAWEQALDAFRRADGSQAGAKVRLISLACQGIVYDILGQRDNAIAKYKAALDVDYPDDFRIHRWNILLNRTWIQARLAEPFSREMLSEK